MSYLDLIRPSKMTYLNLLRSAEYKLDMGHITLRRYEEMIEPLKREIQPEVIRCKDCKYAHLTNDKKSCKYCDQFTDDYDQVVEMYFDSDFYCGYAERREK